MFKISMLNGLSSTQSRPQHASPRACVVPMAGLEPARLAPLPPQDSVSTNSTTSAGYSDINVPRPRL